MTDNESGESMTGSTRIQVTSSSADDLDAILEIVNDAAMIFRRLIPPDRWHEPYMPREEAASEIADGVVFWCARLDGRIVGVMGLQRKNDADLIRHAYVRPDLQGAGIGSVLLKHLESVAERPILLGTWRANEPAIGFYRRHDYELVGEEHRESLLRTYWAIPERQIEESIVMASPAWLALHCAGD